MVPKIRIHASDLVGKEIGRLKVENYIGSYEATTKGGTRIRHDYYCSCICGGERIVQRGNLLNERTKSCGCLRKKVNQ